MSFKCEKSAALVVEHIRTKYSVDGLPVIGTVGNDDCNVALVSAYVDGVQTHWAWCVGQFPTEEFRTMADILPLDRTHISYLVIPEDYNGFGTVVCVTTHPIMTLIR